MIRQYPCNNHNCGRGKKRTFYYDHAEKSGSEPNQVVLWFHCGRCGSKYSIMQYVAQAQMGPSRIEIEDVSQIEVNPYGDPQRIL